MQREEREVGRQKGELKSLELSSQQQQHMLQQHITERNKALQEERDTVRTLKDDKTSLQLSVRAAMQEIERRRREVSELGGMLIDQNEDMKKSLNHVTVATEENMDCFAVSLRTAKDSLRRSQSTCQDQQLTILDLEQAVQKLEFALQEKKEAEVGLRVRAASAEGCLRVTTANAQTRIQEQDKTIDGLKHELAVTNETLDTHKRATALAEDETRAQIMGLEASLARMKHECERVADERDALDTTLQRHDNEAARDKQDAAAREHTLETDLVAERAKSSDLGRANADLGRKVTEACADAQKLKYVKNAVVLFRDSLLYMS